MTCVELYRRSTDVSYGIQLYLSLFGFTTRSRLGANEVHDSSGTRVLGLGYYTSMLYEFVHSCFIYL
eukprot:SAG31_NODE_2830_length_5027_cov_3.418425_2_plen_67_part_00